MERNVLILPSNKHPSLILGSCLDPHYYTKHSTARKEKKKKSHVGLKRSGLPIRVVRLLYKKLGQLRWDVVVQW